jgi:glutamyl-tRNA(Gln) amidotransferase subunit D
MLTKVVLLTAGGTIGSIVGNGAVVVDPTAKMLHQEINRICKHYPFEVDVIEIFNKHSEELLPDDWGQIASTVQNCINTGSTRIVITHGTDTLAYTAAAMYLLFGNSAVRICLTASFFPFGNRSSDAPLNVIAAFQCVVSNDIANGVYVAFRASGKKNIASIIRASDLKPMLFDDTAFSCVYDRRIASFRLGKPMRIESRVPSDEAVVLGGRVPARGLLNRAAQRLLHVRTYPGINLAQLVCIDNLDAIIFELYHSGTAQSEGPTSILSLVERYSPRTAIFLTALSSAHVQTPYISTLRLINAGGRVFKDIQAHVLYVAVVVARAQGKSIQELDELLRPWSYS